MEADNLFLDENVNFKVGRKKRKAMETLNVSGGRICFSQEDLEILEDPRTPTLRRISYGIVLPAICCLGIIGNMLNLLVLTRRNMRGTAYIYMRGESILLLMLLINFIFFSSFFFFFLLSIL